MRRASPKYVPREWILVQAYKAAEAGDLSILHELVRWCGTSIWADDAHRQVLTLPHSLRRPRKRCSNLPTMSIQTRSPSTTAARPR